MESDLTVKYVIKDGQYLPCIEENQVYFRDATIVAASRTIRDIYAKRSVLFTLPALIAGYTSNEFDSKTLSAIAGGLGVLAISSIFQLIKSNKKYNQDLELIASRGWASKEDLMSYNYESLNL